MDNPNKNNIERVGKKLEFYATLSMFFPLVLESLARLAGTAQIEIDGAILAYSGLFIFFAVINYTIFQWQSSRLSEKTLKCLSWIYTIIIISFAYITLCFGMVANNNSEIAGIGLLISTSLYVPVTIIMMCLPVVSILFMVIDQVWRFIKNT